MKQLAPFGCIGSIVFIIVLLFGAINPGPPLMDGQVLAMQLGSTVWGIQQCLAEATHTRIFFNEAHNAYTFLWPVMDGWGFALSGGTPELVAKMLKYGSNFANARTVGQLTQTMLENGWRVIPAAAVPTHIKVAIAGANVAGQLSATWTTLLIVPAGVTFDLLEQYHLWSGDWT